MTEMRGLRLENIEFQNMVAELVHKTQNNGGRESSLCGGREARGLTPDAEPGGGSGGKREHLEALQLVAQGPDLALVWRGQRGGGKLQKP